MDRRQVFIYAALSVLITVALAFGWEFFLDAGGSIDPDLGHRDKNDAVRWVHVLVNTAFATVSVGILLLFTMRLIRELEARERSKHKEEQQRLSFAADAAHELRTPLAILRTHIDSLDVNDTTRQLRDDVEHISRIVEQVLAKSRVEAIDVKPDEMVDLAKLCQDLSAYLAPLVIKEGRSIELVGADRPTIINANAFAVEQALRNLVENAIKYSARRSTITVEVVSQADEHQLRVIDRGRGIPQEARDLIFKRFHRADRRGGGSGLGLSIVRRVAEAHGGRVSVKDAPEGGAVFILHFARRRR